MALSWLPASALAQKLDFTKIQSRVTKVAGNVYMIDGTGGFAGGNIGVSVGEDGILIVDDQFAPLADKIAAALKGITDKPVRFVLNTHFHGDHTNGNRIWGQKATVIAHDNVRKRMQEGTPDPDPQKRREPEPKVALPIVTFDHTATVYLNGEEIRAVHFPHGHTDGDSVVWFTKSNVVHIGDDFFNGIYPFIDVSSGGSVQGLIANLEQLLPQLKPDTKLIPGHGPVGTVDDLKNFLAMLKDSSAIVSRGIKEGKSLEQLKKEHVLAKYDKWAWAFFKSDDFVELLYNATQQKGDYKAH
jgi:glyoxylase-like metal-dependent hydrolase (beta-lactamase superfamily II)